MIYKTAALAVTTLLACSPSALAQEKKSGEAKARWITIAEHGLKVELPARWKERESKDLVLSAEGPAGNGGTVRLSIRSAPSVTAAIIKTEAFAQQLRESLSKALKYEPAGDGAMEIAGSPAMWLRGDLGANQIGQYVFVGEGGGFIATFLYPMDGAEQSAKEAESIMSSVGVVPKKARAAKSSGAKEGGAEAEDLGAKIVKGRVQAAHGFSLRMPKGWQLKKPRTSAFLVMTGSGEMSINVRREPALTSKLSPKPVAAEMEKSLKEAVDPNYDIRSSRSVRIAKRACVWMEARFTQQERKLANLQLLMPGKTHGFIVTFTATAKAYPKNISKIKSALRSIRID